MPYPKETDLRQAIDTLKRGGVIIYPTDTVWGIGCDATNASAVAKVFEIKHRADSKALILLVDSIDALYGCVENVPEVAEQLIEAAVNPTTIIYDHASRRIAPNAVADDGSVAVRITSEAFSCELCRRFRRPIVSTSANISGKPAARCFSEIDATLLQSADYVVAYRRDDNSRPQPSSIIKISDDATFKIIR